MHYTGRIPDSLDPRLERRDPVEFTHGEFIRFQRISRAKNPDGNVHWTLDDKGRLRVAWHVDGSGDRDDPFGAAIPDQPNGKVSGSVVRKIRRLIDRENFGDADPYQIGAEVKGGDFQVVTAKADGTVHEVIYESVDADIETKLLTLLRSVTDDAASDVR